MKRIIRTGNRQAELEWKNDEDRITATLAWQDPGGSSTRRLRYAEVEPGVYSLLDRERALEARVTPGLEGWIVELAGRRITVEVEDPRELSGRARGFGAEGQQSIRSPMPGKVVRVLVEEGVRVEEGQGLVVVEAMKMQNEMKAPKSGKVIALAARAGASVTAGEVLVTLE
ncbi:MAG: biotin/lipoyl-binding protein [Bryobacterales bacterium]|nr:biotin/lipoyl-binding protein [Bryobacterales bacterium]